MCFFARGRASNDGADDFVRVGSRTSMVANGRRHRIAATLIGSLKHLCIRIDNFKQPVLRISLHP